jgi:hypothetical protein
MKRKMFKVGDKIEGKTTNGNIIVGTIVKINKTTYKLDSGALIKFDSASEINEEYWELIIENRTKTALYMALKTVDYTKMPFKSVKDAFISLFGEAHYELVVGSIRKQLGL